MALVRTTDTEEYHDRYSYRTDDFQFIVLTDDDPPSSVMENFFPINIVWSLNIQDNIKYVRP